MNNKNDDKDTSHSERHIELEEFLYLSNKMIINNQTSSNTEMIKSFITDDITDREFNSLKEEIKYLMFCLLNFYTFSEIMIKRKLLNVNNKKEQDHFIALTNFSLERAFLSSFNDFDYSLTKFQNRYGKYTYYLTEYKYQHFERSFVECFIAQVSGAFEDNENPIDIDLMQLLEVGRWIFKTYGEITQKTLSQQNFIL